MKRTFSIRLDEETIERLKEIAENEGRSVSNLIERLILSALDDG